MTAIDTSLDIMKQLVREETFDVLEKYEQVTADHGKLVELIIELNFKYQPLSFTSNDQIEELWTAIDKVPDGAAMIMEITQRFFMYYPAHHKAGVDVLERFSTAAGIMQPFQADSTGMVKSAIPEAALKEMPSATYLRFLQGNRWLVIVILLSLQNVLTTQAAYEAARAASDKPGGKE